jgi:hypothetical protein
MFFWAAKPHLSVTQSLTNWRLPQRTKTDNGLAFMARCDYNQYYC